MTLDFGRLGPLARHHHVVHEVDVLFVTALPLEASAVAGLLDDLVVTASPGLERAFLRGRLRLSDASFASVVLAEIGVGHVSAASRTAELFAELRPRIAILAGIAGGVKDVGHGDVVVATKVSILDYGKYVAGGFTPRADQYRCSPRLLSLARTTLLVGSLGQPADSQVQVAPMVAVNGVVAAKGEMTAAIASAFSDAVALSMEDGGFLAATEGTAVEAIAVRGISDLLDDKRPEDDATRQPAAAAAAAAVAVALARAALVADTQVSPPPTIGAAPESWRARLSDLPCSTSLTATDALTAPGARVITGISGVGKTSVLAELAQHAAASGRDVLWLDATDPVVAATALYERFPQQADSPWTDLGAGLRTQNDLLVLLDNASQYNLRPFLPPYLAGAVVATSTETTWPPPWRTHRLSTMDEHDAVRLLVETSGIEETEDVRNLARFVDGLPMAVVQIGLYLRASGMPPDAYLALLATRTAATLELSNVGPAIEAVLDQAMDRLWNLSPDAALLAVLWAHLPSAPIPIETILELGEHELLPLVTTPQNDALSLTGLVRLIAGHGLLTLANQRGSMHALTAAVLTDRYRDNPELDRVLFHAATIALFAGRATHTSHSGAVRLARGVADLLQENAAYPWLQVMLGRTAASRLFAQGGLHDAVAEVGRVVAVNAPLLDDSETGRVARERAEVDDDQFLDVAVDLNRLVGLATCMLGDPSGLASLKISVEQAASLHDAERLANAHSALGRGYRSVGDHEQALRALEVAVAIYVNELPEHPGRLLELANLARLHVDASRLGGARETLREFDELARGMEVSPDLRSLRHELGVEIEGDLDEQLELLSTAANVPDDDPLLDRRTRSVARTNLAVLMERRGDIGEAFEMLSQSIRDATLVWGKDSVEVGLRLGHFAAFLASTGDTAEAREALEDARARLSDDVELRRLNFVEACILFAEARYDEVAPLLHDAQAGALAPSSRVDESEKRAGEDLIRQADAARDEAGSHSE